jgi:hypothetical protein
MTIGVGKTMLLMLQPRIRIAVAAQYRHCRSERYLKATLKGADRCEPEFGSRDRGGSVIQFFPGPGCLRWDRPSYGRPACETEYELRMLLDYCRSSGAQGLFFSPFLGRRHFCKGLVPALDILFGYTVGLHELETSTRPPGSMSMQGVEPPIHAFFLKRTRSCLSNYI